MPNSDPSHWDETSPTLSQPRRDGAAEILSLRQGIRERLSKEHVAPGPSDVGGEHLAGSARSYYQTTAPTQNPDTSASLGADDAGRTWFDSDGGVLWVWTGSTWSRVATQGISFSTASVNAAQLPTVGGWTNSTGNPVIVHLTCSRSGSTAFTAQVDYLGDGNWSDVADANLIGSFRFLFASIMVPNGGKLRTSLTDVSGFGARAQRFVYPDW